MQNEKVPAAMQDNVTQDPEVIYLQPECCVCPDGEGRQWCEDDFVWECEEDSEPTKYIRADLASTTAQSEAVQKLAEALEEISDLHGEINPSNYDHDDACELNRQFCYAITTAEAALAAHRESQP